MAALVAFRIFQNSFLGLTVDRHTGSLMVGSRWHRRVHRPDLPRAADGPKPFHAAGGLPGHRRLHQHAGGRQPFLISAFWRRTCSRTSKICRRPVPGGPGRLGRRANRALPKAKTARYVTGLDWWPAHSPLSHAGAFLPSPDLHPRAAADGHGRGVVPRHRPTGSCLQGLLPSARPTARCRPDPPRSRAARGWRPSPTSRSRDLPVGIPCTVRPEAFPAHPAAHGLPPGAPRIPEIQVLDGDRRGPGVRARSSRAAVAARSSPSRVPASCPANSRGMVTGARPGCPRHPAGRRPGGRRSGPPPPLRMTAAPRAPEPARRRNPTTHPNTSAP